MLHALRPRKFTRKPLKLKLYTVSIKFPPHAKGHRFWMQQLGVSIHHILLLRRVKEGETFNFRLVTKNRTNPSLHLFMSSMILTHANIIGGYTSWTMWPIKGERFSWNKPRTASPKATPKESLPTVYQMRHKHESPSARD